MKTKTATTILISLAVITVLLFFLASRPSGPPWIPEQPPSEDHRVTHPKGFSITKPPGWFAQIEIEQKGVLSEDAIHLKSTDKKIRFYPMLHLSSHERFSLSPERGTPYYVSNYVETEFLKMKAYAKTDLRAGNGDYFTRELWITNKGRWYNLVYQIPADIQSPPITNVPGGMVPYLESFRPIP